MRIGIPREIKAREHRVSMVPAGVEMLVRAGHLVFVEQGAGQGAGIADDAYAAAGAEICLAAAPIWERADMIVKVKEPLPPEYGLLRPGQILYTYLHLAAAPELAKELVERRVTAIGYETIEGRDGGHK